MGSISRLGEGRYRLRVEQTLPGGERKWHSETCRGSRTVCEKRLATLTANPAEIASKEPLKTYLEERWLPHYGRTYRESSYRQREIQVRRWLVPRLGAVPLGKLDAATIERELDAMREAGASGTTLRDVLACLSAALNQAVRWGLLPRNPAARVTLPAVARERRPIWTPEEAARFLAQGEGAWGMLWWLLARTGLRLGEALALRWGDVDWTAPAIRVERTVTRRRRGEAGGAETEGPPKSEAGRREVVIGPDLVARLRAWRVEQGAARQAAGLPLAVNGYICARADGRRLATGSVAGEWRRQAAAAGVPPDPARHGLRHLATTVQLAAGVPLKTVSARLGHSQIAITADLYGHVLREHQAGAAGVLDAAFVAGPDAEPTPIRGEPAADVPGM